MAVAADVRPGQRLRGQSAGWSPSRSERRNRCSPRQTYKSGRSATVYAREQHRQARSVRSGRFESVPRGSRSRRDYCRGLAPTPHPPSDPRIARPPSDGGFTHLAIDCGVFRQGSFEPGATPERRRGNRPNPTRRHGTRMTTGTRRNDARSNGTEPNDTRPNGGNA